MLRTFLIAILIIPIFAFGAGASEAVKGNFQINTIFMTASYPLSNGGGKSIMRHSSVGISLKSTRGEKLHGMINLTVLFPYVYEAQIYPAKSFSSGSVNRTPLGLDGVFGLAYAFDFSPMVLLVSAGFHTGVFIEGTNALIACGIGLDAQTFVKFSRVLTAQIGIKLDLDFGGSQNFSGDSNRFAGLPIAVGFYTGMGLKF